MKNIRKDVFLVYVLLFLGILSIIALIFNLILDFFGK